MSLVVLACMSVLLGADEPTYLDAPIINGAVPMAEPGRYESPRPYDETLTHYKWHFKNAIQALLSP